LIEYIPDAIYMDIDDLEAFCSYVWRYIEPRLPCDSVSNDDDDDKHDNDDDEHTACELCEREIFLTFHHLRPRETHKKVV